MTVFTILLVNMSGILERLTMKPSSRSSYWSTCFRCVGRNGLLRIQNSAFFFQPDPYCRCVYLWTTLGTSSNGPRYLRCVGLDSFTKFMLRLQKGIDQCLVSTFANQVFSRWSGQWYLRIRGSHICGTRKGILFDHITDLYNRRGTILIL